METAREVVEQVFGELKALLGPNDRLTVALLPNGHLLSAILIDKRGGHVAYSLDHVIEVLAARIE